MKAIGYIRVSTQEQGLEDRYGKEAQREAIKEYAERNGYEIVEWVEDEISGIKDNREGLNSLLYGEIKNPPIEAVIVYKNDRIARDTKLYFYYLYLLEKKGVKLLSTKEIFEEGNEFANIYRALMLFVAEQERKNITIRTSAGRKVKSSKGGYSGGGTPLGYKSIGGKLELVESEAEIVRKIFELRDNGVVYLKIVDYLNEKGYKTKRGKVFVMNIVRTIVENRKFYEGYYRYGEMEWVKGEHKPILVGE